VHCLSCLANRCSCYSFHYSASTCTTHSWTTLPLFDALTLSLSSTLKKTTYGNLKKIYKMQEKSCRNIFRVYQKQDNFSTELKLRERVMSQTLFRPISTSSSMIYFYSLNGSRKPLKRPFDQC